VPTQSYGNFGLSLKQDDHELQGLQFELHFTAGHPSSPGARAWGLSCGANACSPRRTSSAQAFNPLVQGSTPGAPLLKPPEWWHPVHTHDAAHVWLRETSVRAQAYS